MTPTRRFLPLAIILFVLTSCRDTGPTGLEEVPEPDADGKLVENLDIGQWATDPISIAPQFADVITFQCSEIVRKPQGIARATVKRFFHKPPGFEWDGSSILIGKRKVDSDGREVFLGFCRIPVHPAAVAQAAKELGFNVRDLRPLDAEDLPAGWRERWQRGRGGSHPQVQFGQDALRIRPGVGDALGNDLGPIMASGSCLLYWPLLGCVVWGVDGFVVEGQGSGYEPMPDEPEYPDEPDGSGGGSTTSQTISPQSICDDLVAEDGYDTCQVLPTTQRGLIDLFFDVQYVANGDTIKYRSDDWHCNEMKQSSLNAFHDPAFVMVTGDTSPALIAGEMKTVAMTTLLAGTEPVGLFISTEIMNQTDKRQVLLSVAHEAYHIWSGNGGTDEAEVSAKDASRYCVVGVSGIDPWIQ